MHEWISKNNSNIVRAIAAIGIMYTHMGLTIQDASCGILRLSNVGYLCVGIFYFYSGYTLVAVVQKRGTRGFVLNKFKRIYLPFVFANIFYICYLLFSGEYVITTHGLISDITGAGFVNFISWYVTSILCFEGLFWIFHRPLSLLKGRRIQNFMTSRVGILLFVFLAFAAYTVVYPFIAYYIGGECGIREHYPFCILLGALVRAFEEELYPAVSKYKAPILALTAGLLIICCGNNDLGIQHYIGNYNLDAGAAPLLAAILVNVMICDEHAHSKVLTWIGSISYEIYLVHLIFLFLLRGNRIYVENDWLYLAVYTVTLLAFATAFHKLNQLISQGIDFWTAR